jgi:hypothetical protein
MPRKATPATLNRRYRQTGCWIGRGPASAVQRPPGHGSSADLAGLARATTRERATRQNGRYVMVWASIGPFDASGFSARK